jgi:hypothetical protein
MKQVEKKKQADSRLKLLERFNALKRMNNNGF